MQFSLYRRCVCILINHILKSSDNFSGIGGIYTNGQYLYNFKIFIVDLILLALGSSRKIQTTSDASGK